MGGGTVWRSMTRLAGAVSPAVRAAGSSSNACSFCRMNSSKPAVSSQARFSSCNCRADSPSRGNVSGGVRVLWEPDEWEFAEEEERVDHLVFGTLPSQEEVAEASSDLQNALRLGLVAPSSDQPEALWSASPAMFSTTARSALTQETRSDEQSNGDAVGGPVGAQQMALDWIEPPPLQTGVRIIQPVGRNNVAEAFYQFQNNPEVQGMVVSIANDPAVWEAVLGNEKIQEFKRKLQGDKTFFASKQIAYVGEESKPQTGFTAMFTRLFWHNKMSQFVDILNNIINSLFKVADKKAIAEDDGDTFERTVKSCTMLGLVVVCIVILKRLGVQAS